MEEILKCLILSLKLHCKLLRYSSDKRDPFTDDNQLFTRTSEITVNLDMPLQIETRTNGAIAILRGPLNFTVKLSFNQTTTIYLQYNSMIKCRESNLKVSRSTQALGDIKRLFPNAPAQYLTTVCILILLVFPSSYISCRLTIILKTTPFFPLIPSSSQLIHRLS